jgi:hypothetical protein
MMSGPGPLLGRPGCVSATAKSGTALTPTPSGVEEQANSQLLQGMSRREKSGV